MTTRKFFIPKLLLLFFAGAAFGLWMNHMFFSVTPNLHPKYSIPIDIFNWTIGLPMILSAMIASTDTVKLLVCGEMGKSTFGCWGGLTYGLSILLYSLIFPLSYFLLLERHKTDGIWDTIQKQVKESNRSVNLESKLKKLYPNSGHDKEKDKAKNKK
jgi:hypothetical protein